MANQVMAEVGWAVWSKLPGTREDYSVLSCSDTFSKADFAKIIARYTAGTPDTRIAQGAAALPWVTVSWVGVDEALQVGLAITDHTGQVDGVGRPITEIRYFCVPYDQLKRDAVSYTALYTAVKDVKDAIRFPESGQPLRLAISGPGSAEMLASVLNDKIDERAVGSAAGLLLNGSVSLIQAESSTVDQRLAYIDAVASLLPYGFRAKLTASTWADSGVRHRLRIAFAARPKDDAVAVSWRHGGEITTGSGIGRRYFDEFRQITANGDNGRPFPATRVAQILARYAEPQRFEQPEPALAILRGINRPWQLRLAIKDKEAVDLAELRAIFEEKRLAELDPPRTDLLNELSLRGERRDWSLFVNSLGEVGEDRKGIGSALAQFGNRLLWNANPAEAAVRQCLSIAASYGMVDNVLAYLVRMHVPTGHDDGVRILASLIEGAVVDGGGNYAGYPFTEQQLAANPVAAAQLMAALPPVAAAELLTWLAASLPVSLERTFSWALRSRRGKPVEADIADLSQLGDDCVRALLRAASGNGRLDGILSAFTGWFAIQGMSSQDDRRYWQQTLAGLNPTDAQQRAYLDTALLSISAVPTALPPPVGHPDYPDYANHFVNIVKRLAATPERFAARTFMRALAAYLDRQPWAASKQQAHAIVELGERLRKYDQEGVLTGALANGLDANPAAKGWDFAQQLLEWVRKNEPDAVRNGLLTSLEGLSPSTPPAKLAELCRRAATQNVKPDAAYSALSKSGAIGTPAAAANLLWLLSLEFDNARLEPKVTTDWLRRFAAAIARGDFSGARVNFPREVRDQVSQKARRSMWRHYNVLATMTKAIRDAQYDLTDEERDDLDALANAIDVFLKKAAKRPSLWKNVLPGGRFDDEARPGPRPDDEQEVREFR